MNDAFPPAAAPALTNEQCDAILRECKVMEIVDGFRLEPKVHIDLGRRIVRAGYAARPAAAEPVARVVAANDGIQYPHIERLRDVGPFVGCNLYASPPAAEPPGAKYRPRAELLEILERLRDSFTCASSEASTISEAIARIESDAAAEPVSNATVSAAMKIGAAAALRYGPPAAEPPPKAWADVCAERERQVRVEGWTPEHDDEHDRAELAIAAASYALAAGNLVGEGGKYWPWGDEWPLKSTTPRRDLVKAGALILAEIERIDRASAAEAKEPK